MDNEIKKMFKKTLEVRSIFSGLESGFLGETHEGAFRIEAKVALDRLRTLVQMHESIVNLHNEIGEIKNRRYDDLDENDITFVRNYEFSFLNSYAKNYSEVASILRGLFGSELFKKMYEIVLD